MNRRSFLKSFGLGLAGYIATKRIALTVDSQAMLAANEAARTYEPVALRQQVNLTRYTNPFSPTGFNIPFTTESYGSGYDSPYVVSL